jgi:hypothetical protein
MNIAQLRVRVDDLRKERPLSLCGLVQALQVSKCLSDMPRSLKERPKLQQAERRLGVPTYNLSQILCLQERNLILTGPRQQITCRKTRSDYEHMMGVSMGSVVPHRNPIDLPFRDSCITTGLCIHNHAIQFGAGPCDQIDVSLAGSTQSSCFKSEKVKGISDCQLESSRILRISLRRQQLTDQRINLR